MSAAGTRRLAIVGHACVIDNGTGMAVYDDATGQLYGFVPFEGRTDLFFLVGTKQ